MIRLELWRAVLGLTVVGIVLHIHGLAFCLQGYVGYRHNTWYIRKDSNN